jgi:hypothetical protein
MSVPLRRDNTTTEEGLSTADLAQSKRSFVTEELRHAPVPSEITSTVPSEKVAPDARYPTEGTPLFPNGELEDLRNRWKGVQTAFVDEPRRAVEQADGLVASAMKRLAEVFAEERSKLEKQWDLGDNVSTEDLRIALQRYRSFFHRLLSI